VEKGFLRNEANGRWTIRLTRGLICALPKSGAAQLPPRRGGVVVAICRATGAVQ
jgi:hypothetical protein